MVPVMIYTNSRGQSITFRNHAPYMMETYSGTGGSAVDVQTQKAPFQDGESHIDTMMEMRNIFLQVVLIGETHQGMLNLRREVSQVFNPKLEGTLRYESATGIYEIPVVPDGAPEYPGGDSRGNHWQRAVVSLVASDPFWLSLEEESQPMSATMGGLEYPIEFEPDMMFEEAGELQSFYNSGDVATPVEIEFNGPALNPEVRNLTTGEIIKVNEELFVGDVLLINTAFGNKRVTLVQGGIEQNAFNWLDYASSFWQLEHGENIIQYTADTGVEEATVLIRWRLRYVGV